MFLPVLRLLVLVAAASSLFGCASTADTDDPSTDLQPAPSHDDSHGWGTAIKGT